MIGAILKVPSMYHRLDLSNKSKLLCLPNIKILSGPCGPSASRKGSIWPGWCSYSRYVEFWGTTNWAKFTGFGGGACIRIRFRRITFRRAWVFGSWPCAATVRFCTPWLITCAVPNKRTEKHYYDLANHLFTKVNKIKVNVLQNLYFCLMGIC